MTAIHHDSTKLHAATNHRYNDGPASWGCQDHAGGGSGNGTVGSTDRASGLHGRRVSSAGLGGSVMRRAGGASQLPHAVGNSPAPAGPAAPAWLRAATASIPTLPGVLPLPPLLHPALGGPGASMGVLPPAQHPPLWQMAAFPPPACGARALAQLHQAALADPIAACSLLTPATLHTVHAGA